MNVSLHQKISPEVKINMYLKYMYYEFVSFGRGRESWLLYFNCVMTVYVLCRFLMVPWVDLQSVT